MYERRHGSKEIQEGEDRTCLIGKLHNDSVLVHSFVEFVIILEARERK